MFRFMKHALLTLTLLAVSLLPLPVYAAPQSDLATLKLKVEVTDKAFWDCTYMTPDMDHPSKPAVIKAEWSFGNLGKNSKTEVIVANGKLTGEVAITSEKGSILNLDVTVKNEKNVTLGYWGMQLINKGQIETILISPPEEIRPQFTRSNA